MRALLIAPELPRSFWSFSQTLKLQGCKALMPPLGLTTVAAMLPEDWALKLVDRNVREIAESEWRWADMVLLSAMLAQKDDMLALVGAARRRGIPVAVGGPYPTALPEEVRAAGADYLVLDEGEITVPMFLEALARGEARGEFRSGGVRPDLSQTPVPRFDLLELDAYSELGIQFTRGCPFHCEFCDITALYGRRPRTKTPEQILAELQRAYDLGWRNAVFIVDDNFIGNRKAAKQLLQQLGPWMEEHRFPFTLNTQASVDLAKERDILQLMGESGFGAVFLGVETPDVESLETVGKTQNTRADLEEAVRTIARAGLRVMSGFIIGFDDEAPGAGDRVAGFVEKTSIPVAMLSMLQALPGTVLWQRLEKEGRLHGDSQVSGTQTSFSNFAPTRPFEQLLREYDEAFWRLYDPVNFLERTYRHYRELGNASWRKQKRPSSRERSESALDTARILGTVFWRQGVLRKSRWKFWPYLAQMLIHNREVAASYLGICAQYEHFHEFRDIVRSEIREHLQRGRH